MNTPWNLAIEEIDPSTVSSLSVEELSFNVQLLDNVHFSPAGDQLIFRGTVQGRIGLWLYDIADSRGSGA